MKNKFLKMELIDYRGSAFVILVDTATEYKKINYLLGHLSGSVL